ncbi:PorT family protein [Neolewinella aurantiaca]|uniref:PorT family protein n=1 Tax=Neolewinella aurantiaca TaxID=2602767 RepID=A0A5C7FQ48_9BACT|nr:porin family protein [Neolewinella aurantiaca]TXF89912.1 PorT family protein [Neolewinella aurantiaca]
MTKNFTFYRPFMLAVALLLLPAVAFAQFPGDLKFGIQASPTFSGMTTDDNLINRDGTNLGLKLGLIGEYYFRENYSFHTGIGFHFNAGGTLFYEDQFTQADIWRESLDNTLAAGVLPDTLSGGLGFKYDLQFVEIPLGLTLRTREFGYMSYYVRPALHLGFVTKSQGSVQNAGFISEDESFDIGKEVNAINLGWSIGAGVEYSVSESTALIGGLAFQSGFADLTTDKGTTLKREGRDAREDDSKGKLNSIVITLGVMF